MSFPWNKRIKNFQTKIVVAVTATVVVLVVQTDREREREREREKESLVISKATGEQLVHSFVTLLLLNFIPKCDTRTG